MSSSEASDASAPGTPVKSATPSSRGSTPPKNEKSKSRAILTDSEDSDACGAPSRRQTAASDSDENKAGKTKTTTSGGLFGDLSGSSSDEDDAKKTKASEAKREKKPMLSDSEAESRGSMEDLQGIVMANPDEIIDDAEEEEKEEILDSEILSGRVHMEYSEDAPYYVRMPNFLSVATHPFDPQHYEEDEDDEQTKLDDEGRNRLKLRVENTLRWRIRKDEQGREIRESNAKIVKWDDGTMSLYLGNEIFEVTLMELNKNNLPHLYVSQTSFMAAQAVMTHRMTFRPHSTDSQTHRKVTLNMADRSRKNAQVKVMDDVGVNPEITRRENARKEEESLRAHIRRTQMVRNNFKVRRPAYGGAGGGGGGYYSDEEDVGSSRRGRGPRKEAPLIGASSSDEEPAPSSKGGAAKKSGSESDSDKEYRKRKQQQKKRIVSSDEESD